MAQLTRFSNWLKSKVRFMGKQDAEIAMEKANAEYERAVRRHALVTESISRRAEDELRRLHRDRS